MFSYFQKKYENIIFVIKDLKKNSYLCTDF